MQVPHQGPRMGPYWMLGGTWHCVSGMTKAEESQRMHTIFAEGDKNGKLLAMLVADHPPIAHIPVIKDKAGALVSDPAIIMQEFVDFFTSHCMTRRP